MKTITAKKKDIDYKEYVRRTAVVEDYEEFIDYSCIIKDEEGNILALYKELDIDPAPVVNMLNRIDYQATYRVSGLKTLSRIFGFSPRQSLRRDWCNKANLSATDPEADEVLRNLGINLSEMYKKHVPDVFKFHEETVSEQVLNEYRIPDTPFTSGIINKNNELKYHFDSGNFNDVYSNMVVYKHNVDGGYLSLPEYGLGLELKHNSVLFFDGQSILHGVTPIFKLADDAFRYSIVYYSLKQMWKCKPLDDELARIRKKKTERERKRVYENTNSDS